MYAESMSWYTTYYLNSEPSQLADQQLDLPMQLLVSSSNHDLHAPSAIPTLIDGSNNFDASRTRSAEERPCEIPSSSDRQEWRSGCVRA
jgi:hypothetical protein